MSQTVRRQRLRPALPAKSNAATEFAIPKPPPITWEPRDFCPVRQRDWIARGLSVNETRKECICVHSDPRQLFLSGNLSPHVVGRPTSLESCHIAGQILTRWPDQLHYFFHSATKGDQRQRFSRPVG